MHCTPTLCSIRVLEKSPYYYYTLLLHTFPTATPLVPNFWMNKIQNCLHVLQYNQRFIPLLSFWATLSCCLCSSPDTCILKLQSFNHKTHGFHAFSHFGPHMWNNLSQYIRHYATLSFSKANSRQFSFQSISVKQHCPSHYNQYKSVQYILFSAKRCAKRCARKEDRGTKKNKADRMWVSNAFFLNEHMWSHPPVKGEGSAALRSWEVWLSVWFVTKCWTYTLQQAHITVLLIMQLPVKIQLILQNVIPMSITKWTVVVPCHTEQHAMHRLLQ